MSHAPVDIYWGAPHLCKQLPMLSRDACIAYEAERDLIFNRQLANRINDDEAARALRRLAKRIDGAVAEAEKGKA